MSADSTSRNAATDSTVVEQAHNSIVGAASEFAKHVDEIQRERHHLTEDGFRARIAAFAKTPPAAAIEEAVSQVQKRAEEAATLVDKLRRDMSVPNDAAAEMRAGRVWARAQRMLDHTGNAKVVSAAKALLDEADPADLGILCEELSPYLQSRGLPDKWVEAALGEVMPQYGAARVQRTKAEQARTVVEYNAKMLRKGFAEGRLPAVLADPHKYDPDN